MTDDDKYGFQLAKKEGFTVDDVGCEACDNGGRMCSGSPPRGEPSLQTELLQCSRETRRYVLELVESHASLLDACKALVTMRDGAMAAIRKAVEKAEGTK